MASKEVMNMSAGPLYERWQKRIERIRTETQYTFMNRKHFRDVAQLFQDNEQLLKEGHNVYEWLMGMWGRDAIMGVRRELDDQAGVENLLHLMYEMEARPEVMNRRRYLALLQPTDDPHVVELMNQGASKLFPVLHSESADPMDAHIDRAEVRADREKLQTATKTVFEYAQRLVAHRTPLETLELTVGQIHDALDAIEPMLKRYYLLLTGKSLAQATPSVTYFWMKPFTYAWMKK